MGPYGQHANLTSVSICQIQSRLVPFGLNTLTPFGERLLNQRVRLVKNMLNWQPNTIRMSPIDNIVYR